MAKASTSDATWSVPRHRMTGSSLRQKSYTRRNPRVPEALFSRCVVRPRPTHSLVLTPARISANAIVAGQFVEAVLGRAVEHRQWTQRFEVFDRIAWYYQHAGTPCRRQATRRWGAGSGHGRQAYPADDGRARKASDWGGSARKRLVSPAIYSADYSAHRPGAVAPHQFRHQHVAVALQARAGGRTLGHLQRQFRRPSAHLHQHMADGG